MNRISFKFLIRRFVLATAFPPFINIYRLVYKLVIILTTRIFKKFPEIKAVYLRRGSAKGEILPLISDIDFTVITIDMSEDVRNRLINDYESLANSTTLLDKSLEVYDEETFFRHYETNDYYQYRFTEGKKTWKLISGKDYLAQLPELTIERLYGGFYNEIKIWWTIFEWRFFQNRKYSSESITRNNTCYKAVCEILKMNLALNKGIMEFDRKRALELSLNSFSGSELSLLEKLKTIAEKNFRQNDHTILDETRNFLLKYLDNFYRESRSHPYLMPLKLKTQRVVCRRDEILINEADSDHIRILVDFVKVKWNYTYKGSYLIPGIHLSVDELLLIIKIDIDKIPSARELTEFNLFHSNAKYNGKSRIKLFLLFPDSAFQINTVDFKLSWQSVLSPGFNPDVFELLSKPEFKLDGESYIANTTTYLTQPVEHFICEEKRLFFELLRNPSVYKLDNLDFLRIFWKTVQLVIMSRSVNREEIIYPLTIPAIEEALIDERIPIPRGLMNFSDAYRNELSGRSADISLQIPAAINYLRELE